MPNWQSTNAGESSSTSSYTYKFTTSSSGSTLSFDWSVSSEESWDFLTITLDGAQILKESGIKSSSYSKDFNDNNEHTLVCTYSKDGSVDNGDDCASVNNVVVKTMNNTSNPVVIPNNTIYYTSSDGNIVNPYKTDVFGANIVSNTYENGQGIISFDGDVTSIGEYAFWTCTGLTSITIPNSVTSIGEDAFSGCYSLTSITIPSSLYYIGSYTFHSCSSLTSITIPNSVRGIGDGAFSNCTGLTSITIPNSEIHIGWYAFSGCSSLTSIVVDAQNTNYDSRNNCNAIIETSTNTLLCGCMNTVIPNSVTSIGNFAFYGCSGLTSITIPNSVTSIGDYAFSGCSGLTSITIPNSVTSIGNWTFESCSSLTSIVVDARNANYDSRDNCNAIIETSTNTLLWGCENTVIPNSVTSIGVAAFDHCSGLTSITIPNSVTSIGHSAFRSCRGLTSITIPNSVTSIGSETFSFCSNLTSITIPNSVTSIGNWTFESCSSLMSITIPNSVTSIGNGVFYNCSGLTSVTNLSTIPQTISSGTFSKYGTLHVLPDCKETYQNADYWKNFTIVEDAVDPYRIVLADGTTYSEETTQFNKNFTYTRTFNNTSWQALYVPFAMSYEDWKDDFDVSYINGIRQYDKNEDGVIEETVMDVIMIKNGSLIPNTPYLIRAKSVGEKSITINNATLFKAEDNSIDCSTTIARYTFTGTYIPIPASVLIENNYYAMGGGALVISSGSDLKPYRWYMQIDARSPLFDIKDAAKRITINLVSEDDVVSGIIEYTNTQHSSSDSQIYDLNGRKVSKSALKAGVYIKNGKKVVIKTNTCE